MLKALEGELVKIVVDIHDLDLGKSIVLQQLKHQLGVDQAAQVEDQVLNGQLHGLEQIFECELDVLFKGLSEVLGIQFFDPHHLHLIEVLAVIFAKIANKILVDHLVSNTCSLKLRKLELNRI